MPTTRRSMMLNKKWHLAHPMPPRATQAQRAKWHIQHAKHCACREMSPAIRALVRQFQRRRGKTGGHAT